MMRILFLHTARNLNVEYNIHRMLVENADPSSFEAHFVWQDNTHDRRLNRGAVVGSSDVNTFHDFGRNLSLPLSRRRRAVEMGRRLPQSRQKLVSTVREFEPTLIYTSQQQLDVRWARFLSRKFHLPHCIHINYPVGPWLGSHAVDAIRTSSTLLASSEFVRGTALEIGVDPNGIQVVPNAIEAARFDVAPDRAWLREEFNWPADSLVVTSAGRLDPSKGHLELIEAFDSVRKTVPQTRLLICGEGSWGDGHPEILKSRVTDLGLDDYVEFAGQRNDLESILAASDVFCLPTVNEAFGLVFPEAMAAGLPVVALRSGGVPEIVLDGECGLLSEVGDVTALSDNMTTLLLDPGKRQQMQEAGRRRAYQEYDASGVSRKWLAALEAAVMGTT
jgi:glycosyltransferase involved in cell wall biosynthesis